MVASPMQLTPINKLGIRPLIKLHFAQSHICFGLRLELIKGIGFTEPSIKGTLPLLSHIIHTRIY
jgi:hypothetical protein